MNVREYMHDITAQNANTLASEEGQAEGKKKMTKEETLQEQQSKNKVRQRIRVCTSYVSLCPGVP